MESQALKTAEFLEQKNQKKAKIALILGSGLGDFVHRTKVNLEIPYSEIPFFSHSTVQGHKGKFIFAETGDTSLYIFQGRFHYYEGKSLEEVIFPIRVLKKLGVKVLVVTNAAGSINERFKPGEFMLIKDHLNLMGVNPLRGKNWDEWGPRFPDLSNAYDEELRKIAKKVAQETKLSLKEGVYAAVSGPSYETPAEIKMLKTLGADAVGMSTVPEVIIANHQGTRVCGFSCLTNVASGLSCHEVSHEEVLEMTKQVSEKFGRFLERFIVKIIP